MVGTQEVSLGQLGIGGHASKYAALTNALTQVMRFLTVVLGFVIPLSTTATEVVLLLVFLCWLCSGDYAGKLQTIWRSKVAVLSLAMFRWKISLLSTVKIRPGVGRPLDRRPHFAWSKTKVAGLVN